MTPTATPLAAELQGKTCLVTGGNSGIGKAAALSLAQRGAHVVLACRDERRGARARTEIAAATGNAHVELMLADFSLQTSIRDFASRVLDRFRTLDVLINNAGTWSDKRQETAEGIEQVWATNVLGYALTTSLLMELLVRSRARIVNVASMLARDLDLDDVEFRRRTYSGVKAYAQSKQANRMWTWGLARRLDGTGATANAMHPGGVSTGLFRKGGGALSLIAAVWAKLFAKSASAGADTVVWLATDPKLENISGKFWIDRKQAPCRFRGIESEERLWSVCERMTGVSAR